MIATDQTYDVICPNGTSSNNKHKTQASEQGNIVLNQDIWLFCCS